MRSDAARPLPVEPIGLVAIDLDGTLLRDDLSMSMRTLETIQQAQAAGVKVVLATGRAPRGAIAVHRSLGLDTPLITHNGALIVGPTGTTIWNHQPLSAAVAKEVIRISRTRDPQIYFAVEVVDRCFTDVREPAWLGPNMIDGNGAAAASPDALSGPVTKLAFVGDPARLGDIQLTLSRRMVNHVSFAFSHMRLLQVVHLLADKGSAVEMVARHYGLKMDRVMAIGDAPNDLPMLRRVGLSVTMVNAWEEVKSMAHFIMPSNNEDGVAEAIEKYVMGRG